MVTNGRAAMVRLDMPSAIGPRPVVSFADLGKRAVDDHLEGPGKRLVLILPVSRWTTR